MSDPPNEGLRPEDVPGPDAPWHPTIAEFALTFDGYEAMGNRLSGYAWQRFERWRKDGSLPRDLLHLRSCLFMAQRAVRWAENGPCPSGPTAEELAYAHSLIAAIRAVVERTTGCTGPSPNDAAKRRVSVESVPDEDWAEPVTATERARILYQIRDENFGLALQEGNDASEALLSFLHDHGAKTEEIEAAGSSAVVWKGTRYHAVAREKCGVVPDTDAPADFLIRTEGMISLLSPLTERARAWVDENVTDHVEYAGSVVMEDHDVHAILTCIIDDGLSIV